MRKKTFKILILISAITAVVIVFILRANIHTLIDPNPAFGNAFRSASKLEFVLRPYSESERKDIKIDNPREITEFFESFYFDNFPEGLISHCMCGGDPYVIITMDDGSTREFSIHHGRSIRWDAFKHNDLMMTQASIDRLSEFLKRHGIQSK